MSNNKHAQAYEKITQIRDSLEPVKEFNAGFKQKHHFNTTVSDHSLHVALFCFLIGTKITHENFDIDACLRSALLHDIGLINMRKKSLKEMNGHTLAIFHPQESVRIAESYLDLSEKEKNAIVAHMWPLAFTAPHSPEAVVLNISDKIAAFIEVFSFIKK